MERLIFWLVSDGKQLFLLWQRTTGILKEKGEKGA